MPERIRKALIGVAALAALALGGSALAGAATNNSSSSGTSTSATPNAVANNGTSGGANSSGRPAFNGPAPGSAAHEDAETVVTGDAATKAKAAAVKSVGSGTAGEVTTNYTKDGYEVVVTKSDGTKVDVHLDQSFNAQAGGPGQGGPGGPPPSNG